MKWNQRRQDLAGWVARAEADDAFEATRPGKRVALLDLRVVRDWQKQRRGFCPTLRVTERRIDRQDQHGLFPDVSLEGWLTGLDEAPQQGIDRYAKHGTH